ncbi:nuclear transport factor 2 family protein [Kordiimonas sp. SCSIO 12610]|uniref:nuclear transport factor 2 family protein n=1 Tax=Kordiimonas sp. SCSIO 12610 TaxID=2829597 RepID=UPI00210CD567|nr:nuclear transport factor 2 family protein [Kordiimonas sp. SCSIO 12610]UTW55838.1 nuclear transport factor 2 family protein [Kordiimonas sp. SCSIO 12610]
MPKSPRQIADEQLIAYNNHDLEAFCALFHSDAELYDLPSHTLVAKGLDDIRSMYADRFSNKDLRCEVHSKTDLADFAIDRETLSGLPTGTVEIVAMYQVKDDLIHKVYFIRQ